MAHYLLGPEEVSLLWMVKVLLYPLPVSEEDSGLSPTLLLC